MSTIRDVAAYAKVSVATVSHVVNGTRFVDPKTVIRVQNAIDVLGYRPNQLARSLRRNETSTIGLLIPDNSSPFFAKIARTIEDAGFAEGYSVILCNSDGSETSSGAVKPSRHLTSESPVAKVQVCRPRCSRCC